MYACLHKFTHEIEILFFLIKTSRNLRPEEVLQQCKRNIERHYTLVGITEQLLNTMKLLEKLLPGILPSIHKQYKQQIKGRLKLWTLDYEVVVTVIL